MVGFWRGQEASAWPRQLGMDKFVHGWFLAWPGAGRSVHKYVHAVALVQMNGDSFRMNSQFPNRLPLSERLCFRTGWRQFPNQAEAVSEFTRYQFPNEAEVVSEFTPYQFPNEAFLVSE